MRAGGLEGGDGVEVTDASGAGHESERGGSREDDSQGGGCVAAFEANLKIAGFERTSKTETAEALIESFRNEEKTRTIAVTINRKNAEKVVGINYSGK